MRKKLLFSLLASCVAVSGFALSQGEYVYTPQGRFQIIGDNINANSAFNDFAGWTILSASADKSLAEQFNINGNGYAEGINSVQSLDATVGEGMYYKFVPTSASDSYVVSFKMKGTALANTRVRIPGDGNYRADNLVKVFGNSVGDVNDISDTVDLVVCNTAEELTEEWQTFDYAITGDGIARTYFIYFTGMAESIEVADVQIAPAMQFADLRQRDAMLKKLKVYADSYNWAEGLLDDYGMTEAIANLESVGDETGVAELDEFLETAKEVLDEFLKANMDDYLAGNSDNYLGIKTTSGNTQKVSNLGDWQADAGVSGRLFWSSGAYPDLGHYAGNTGWNYGNTDTDMGIYLQKTLDSGSYVFGIESNGAVREDATSSSWTNNEGLDVAYGVAYIVRIVDGVAADTIVSEVKDLEAVNYTPFLLTAKIEEAGTFEIGFKAYCKDAYKSLKNGSVVYVRNASIWGKNDNKYNQKQLGYEADVREQITTGRTQLTTAAEYLANADYLWGKAELQACVDTVETKIAAYELLTQDDIIATYEDDYVKSTSDSLTGYLVYKVYQEAVKDIIAANRKFTAVNDTLNSMQGIIDGAEATIALRVYDAATGKADLQAAIDNAKAVQAQMKADQYSVENAATIVAANATLSDAVAAFKTTIPASAIATVVDIDFENDAVQNEETQTYSITGAAGTMEFSNWSVDGTGTQPFEKGYWSNGEQLYKGYIRVGSGDGIVNFDPTVDGSMGTNILRVSFDFFLQGLSGRSIGFFINNGLDGDEAKTIAAFYANYYNVTVSDNTFDITQTNLQYASGGNYNNVAPEGAEGAGTYTCAKNSFELIFDFGEGSMYATTTSAKGTFTTAKKEFDGTIPYRFDLKCNYNNNDRRAWFDNLKIERITAGAAEPFVDGIAAVKADAKATGIYNLAGQKVDKSYKGIVIVNGKKMIQK
ncbi:MAG: hypothetical protein IJ637_05120 [Prevotella sp.]|nr:hypothetical protein [Prevotella sp.]